MNQDVIRLMCLGSEMTITLNLVIYIETVEQKAQIKQTCLLDNVELCVNFISAIVLLFCVSFVGIITVI